MRVLTTLYLGLALIVASSAPVPAAGPTDDAESVTRRFGDAMTSGDAAALRLLLPERGKVQLTLDRLGSRRGAFSSGQVEALFRDFFRRGEVGSFEVAGIEQEGAGPALARAHARLTDADGRRHRVELRLTLQPEDGRWVVRAIRESSS